MPGKRPPRDPLSDDGDGPLIPSVGLTPADERDLREAHACTARRRGRPPGRTADDGRGRPCSISEDGSEFSPAEVEFLAAADRHRRASGLKFLRARDYLKILLALGYRKPPAPTPGDGHG